jgi:hypothetical protein
MTKSPKQYGGGVCVFGQGDCGSKTSIRNENDQLIINRSDFTQMSKQVNEVVASSIVENAAHDSAHLLNSQEITFEGAEIAGDLNIGEITQEQQAKVSFSSLNENKAANDAATKIIDEAVSQLKNMTTNDVIAKMESHAEAEAKAGALSTSSAGAATDVVNINKLTAITENTKNITKILENKVVNEFKVSNVHDCIASVMQQQSTSFKNAKVGGNVNIKVIGQKQAAELISQCKTINDTTNKILTETMASLGVKVEEETKTKSETEVKTEAKSKSENTGLIQDLGNALGDILGGLLSGLLGPIVIGIIILVIIIAVIILVVKML